MQGAVDTRSTLLEASARLFNSQGYKATSLSEITAATGLTKGAIYAHFGSKDELEKEALQYMLNGFMLKMRQLIKAEKDAKSKLLVILDYFSGYAVNPPFYGGCPLVNASVELDDTDSDLQRIVRKSTQVFHNAILKILANGVRHGQVRSDVDVEALASLIFSAAEGGIILMRITGTRRHLRDVIAYLRVELDRVTNTD